MHWQGQAYNSFEQQKQKMIKDNYASVYHELLPDEGPNASYQQPFYIENKDVYALSDIEGYNIEFLKFLKELGLVEYSEQQQANTNGWKNCLSLKKDFGENNEFLVYYKFNEDKCRQFNDVIVLCGDYVRNSRNVSEGTVKILEELRSLLNFDKQGVGCGTEDKKKTISRCRKP